MKMYQVPFRVAFGLVTACLILPGCATLTTGTTQSVSVTTEKDVQGARCELTDSNGREWYISATPGTVNVRKGDGPMTINCSKDGFETTQLVVAEEIAGATLGNVLLGGGIGLIVDAASGAAQRYPDEIKVWMKPEEWESDEKRLQWEQAKLKTEEEKQKK